VEFGVSPTTPLAILGLVHLLQIALPQFELYQSNHHQELTISWWYPCMGGFYLLQSTAYRQALQPYIQIQ
jgi:hypothetical protein